MAWLFGARDKSVAQSAKKVVAEMHADLERKTKKLAEYENLCAHLQRMAVNSLENELVRLEAKKKDLLVELKDTDSAIIDRTVALAQAREEIRRIMAACSNSADGHGQGPGVSMALFPKSPGPAVDNFLAALELKSNQLEEQYLEEIEMVQGIKQDIPNALFIVHRNVEEGTIVYTPDLTENVVRCFKYAFNHLIMQGVDSDRKTDLSSMEMFISYGAKVIPNHDRDYPHVRELQVPQWLLNGNADGHERSRSQSAEKIEKLAASSSSSSSSGSSSSSSSSNSSAKTATAQLAGAVELPLCPDVIIDVWMFQPDGQPPLYWATTSVDGIGFAVLERVFVISDSVWGLSQAVQVDLFARHPAKGFLLIESIYERETHHDS